MSCRLSELLLVNVLTFGLELCMVIGVIYIPPMLLEAGVQQSFMTMVLGVGPVLGLIFIPPLGSASDGWSGRYGRRRPFIWVLCVGVLLGLVVTPHASQIASFFSKQHQNGMEIFLLISAICLQEFCGLACFTPLEALLSDLYPGKEESHRAYSIHSLMLSLGGSVGYLLSSMDWSILSAASYIGGQKAFIYAVLTALLLVCILSTVFVSEERTSGEIIKTSEKSQGLCSSCCWPLKVFSRTQFLRRALVTVCTIMPRLWSLYSHMPYTISRLFVAKLCSWMALLTFILFYTDFVGEGLYDGIPSAKPDTPERRRYEKGVQVASFGLFLQSVTSVGFSLIMERLVACIGARLIYLSSMALLALSTAMMTMTRNIVLVTALTTATGYTLSVLQILPYTLICLYHSDKQVFFPNKFKPFSSEDGWTMNKSSQTQPSTKYQTMNGNAKHPVSTPVTKAPLDTSATSCSTKIHVAMPMDTKLVSCQATRGRCLDIAILDSAYMGSHIVPSLFMGTIVQLLGSVSAYMLSASVLSLLAFYFSRRIIFKRKDMATLKLQFI